MFIENDIHLDVSRGKINKIHPIEKFGRSDDMQVSNAYDMVDGSTLYAGFPLTDVEVLVASSSSTLDKAAGTGARTVTVYNLLDANGNQMENQTFTLDGTTVVTSDNPVPVWRGSRAKVRTAGSWFLNIGEITIKHQTTTTNVFTIIAALKNQTNQCVYTVPLGKTLHIRTLHANMVRASGANGSAEIALLGRAPGEVWALIKNPNISNALGYDHDTNHIDIPALTDIKGHIYSVSDADTNAYMEFSGLLVDD